MAHDKDTRTPRARPLFRERRELARNAIMEATIWSVPAPVPPSNHGLKYSLVYTVDGERLVGDDLVIMMSAARATIGAMAHGRSLTSFQRPGN